MSSDSDQDPIPPYCVVIGRTRHKMVQIEIKEAAKRGAELLELRLDFLSKAPDFKRLLADKPCQLMATVRRPQDGGRWGGTDDARMMLIRQAIVAGFDWIDLEVDIVDQVPRFGKVRRLVSYHNMKKVPDDLEKIHEAMCGKDVDVVKIAVRAQQPKDVLRVLKLSKGAPKPTVAIAMGDVGLPSRILGRKFGAPFAYAAFNKERSLAPGLLSYDEMRKIYHCHEINPETRVFGVVGDPIGHSLSPLVHNTAFRNTGVNAVYLPFRVPRGELAEHIKLYDRIPIEGYSVTIPHKEACVELASEVEPFVSESGTANTLLRQEDGTFHAINTDYRGAIDSLRAALTERDALPASLASRQVLILGAGGVARAIAYGLQNEGALITIANRTHQKGLKLAEGLQKARAVDWQARHNVNCDIVINCTPIGMHPKVDETPLHPSFLRPDLVVFDTVYIPETTLLLKEAKNRGCKLITGRDFFVRQAAQQFERFTKQPPPIELMDKTVRRALSPVKRASDDD